MAFDYRAHPRVVSAARAIRRGGVIAYPTEAVWGLGADPFHRHAVEHILHLKRRPVAKGVILVAASAEQFHFILQHLPRQHQRTLLASWPGPRTWLVPHLQLVPEWIHGQHQTVALRVSAHPLVQALCQLTGGPIVSTSANPQGLAPARFGYRARQYFGRQVKYAPGQVDLAAKPSEIRDLASGQVVRL